MSLYCPGWNHCPRCLMLRDTFSFSTTDWDVLEGWPRALSDNRLIWFESSKGLQGSRRTTQPLLPPISLPFDSRYFWAPEKKGMSNISNIHKILIPYQVHRLPPCVNLGAMCVPLVLLCLLHSEKVEIIMLQLATHFLFRQWNAGAVELCLPHSWLSFVFQGVFEVVKLVEVCGCNHLFLVQWEQCLQPITVDQWQAPPGDETKTF